MGKRLLALLGAVAMVFIAVTVRDRIDNGGGGRVERGGSGALRLVCATELRAVCDGIDEGDVEITIEPAAVTADRLKQATPANAEIDGWLAPGPWGDIVDASRASSAEELFDDEDTPLARSPFVVAVWKNKRAQLGCPGDVDLGCLGDAVITRGFRLGVSGDDQAEGVLADAALAAGHIKNANFATNDLNETDLADWLTGVDAKVDAVARNPGGRAFDELLTFGPAAADGFLTIEAVAAPHRENAAQRNLDVLAVVPKATADVIFTPRRGDRGARLRDIVQRDRIRELLRASGWRTTDTRGLPAGDGLPSAGVLQALREVTK
jgi:hypothetical protein